MKKIIVVALLCAIATTAVAQPHAAGYVRPHDEIVVPTEDVAVETGAFDADWENLSAWECPEWFSDAKFGIYCYNNDADEGYIDVDYLHYAF